MPSGNKLGVIFSGRTSTTDQSYGWSHGYVMALTNASTITNDTTKTCIWAADTINEAGATYDSFTYQNYVTGYTEFIINKDGYSETHAIADKYSSTLETDHPAFYYALNYAPSGTTYAAPNGSSGWYLPSVGQGWDLLINANNTQQ